MIYELHVGSFNPKPGTGVGTFADVVAKLPYLQSLGINAIELLPVVEFEGDISWGYDPGIPFSVALAYGGPDGLKELVRAAHEAGIAVGRGGLATAVRRRTAGVRARIMDARRFGSSSATTRSPGYRITALTDCVSTPQRTFARSTAAAAWIKRSQRAVSCYKRSMATLT